MAENKVINLKVNTNIDQVSKDTKGLTANIKEASTATADLGEKTGELGGSAGGLKSIKDNVMSLVPGLKSATAAGDGLLTKLWQLVANPIGAIIAGIVLAVKFLYEAFQSSVKGGKELEAMWAGITATGQQVKDAIFGLARAFMHVADAAIKFITLDFDGASKAMKAANKEAAESFNQLGNAVTGNTAKIFYSLEKQQQAINKARKNQAVTQSETDKLLVQSREILTDETASLKDKKKALEAVTKAETASSKEKLRIASEDLRIAKEKAKAMGGEAEKKMKQELRDLTIALNEAETENAMTGIKLNKQRKMLNRQEIADQKEAVDAAKQAAKEKSDKVKEANKIKEDGLKKIADLERAYSDSLLTQQQLDLLNINRKYEEEFKVAEKYKKDTTKLTEAKNAEIKKINDKYDAENLKKQQELNAQRIQLEDQQFKLLQEATLTGQDKEIADLVASYDAKFAIANGNAELEKALEEKQKSDIAAIQDKYRKDKEDKDKQASDKELQAKKTLQDALYQTVSNGLSTIGNIAELFAGKSKAQQKKAFQIQKAVNIAGATIDTFKAATSAFSSMSGIPLVGPVLGGVAAAAAIAAGLVNIKKISSTQFEGGGSGGGAAGSVPSVPNVQAANFNVVGAGGANQLAQLSSNPIKAYVVSGEVSSAQSLDRNIVKNATI
jgi:hypothetical protein